MEEKIVLTLCSLNYIAQAKALGDSLLKHDPSWRLVIGLVDKIDGRIKPDYYAPHELIEVHELNMVRFDEMRNRYSNLELICALKSFYTDHLFNKYKPSKIIFLDCDILVFDKLDVIGNALKETSILITPHITRPYPLDGRKPVEKTILKTGMYNAGFYALRNDEVAKEFISWWMDRMVDQCYERPKQGLNADQKWLNFLPLYFKNMGILTHAGCNVAYWNFHERNIEKRGDRFFVNNEPLIFFHYSGYSIQQPEIISRHQDRFSMNDHPVIRELFQIYVKSMRENDHETLLKIPNYYRKKSSGGWRRKLGLRK